MVRLTAIFGALALLLASVGLYGVTAYGVARRTPEIGLRMALGADRASVVRLVLNGAAEQTGMGLLLGVLLALIAGHYLQSQLYEVKGYNATGGMHGPYAKHAGCERAAGAKGFERGSDAGAADELISSRLGHPARVGSGIAIIGYLQLPQPGEW